MSATALQAEFEYYVAHQDELAAKYNRRYLVIKGQEILGDYENAVDAIRETSKVHAMGTFLVQRCGFGDRTHTQLFHSRVAFA